MSPPTPAMKPSSDMVAEYRSLLAGVVTLGRLDRPHRLIGQHPPSRRERGAIAYGGRVAELVPITRANWRDATAVRVGQGQQRFIAAYEPVALVILSKAFLRVGDVDWWPYLVMDA